MRAWPAFVAVASASGPAVLWLLFPVADFEPVRDIRVCLSALVMSVASLKGRAEAEGARQT